MLFVRKETRLPVPRVHGYSRDPWIRGNDSALRVWTLGHLLDLHRHQFKISDPSGLFQTTRTLPDIWLILYSGSWTNMSIACSKQSGTGSIPLISLMLKWFLAILDWKSAG